jgi:hypothetical protein
MIDLNVFRPDFGETSVDFKCAPIQSRLEVE